MRKLQQKQAKQAAHTAIEPTVVLTEQTEAASPKLPHERDESPSLPAKRQAKMVQAEKDLSAGQQDTDRRSDAAKSFARGPEKRR